MMNTQATAQGAGRVVLAPIARRRALEGVCYACAHGRCKECTGWRRGNHGDGGACQCNRCKGGLK